MSSTIVTTSGLSPTGLFDVSPMTLPELHATEGVVEGEIERANESFEAIGKALREIRDRKGYQLEGHATFKDYVKNRWGWTRQRAYQLMESSEVACQIDLTNGSSTHALQLARLKTPEGQLDVEAVKEVIKEAPGASVRELKELVDGRLLKDRKQQWIDAHTSSESVEWYTPSDYVEAAREVMGGIDLDPATCLKANQTIRATRYFTKEDDGLQHDWPGCVWLNPPYGGLCPSFIKRALEQYSDGITEQAILLLNAHSTDTKWFRPLWDHTLCFTDHRIEFDPAEEKQRTSSTFGSVFVYLGPNERKFAEVFSQFGPIVKKWWPNE